VHETDAQVIDPDTLQELGDGAVGEIVVHGISPTPTPAPAPSSSAAASAFCGPATSATGMPTVISSLSTGSSG
jgi:hypothetical protein